MNNLKRIVALTTTMSMLFSNAIWAGISHDEIVLVYSAEVNKNYKLAFKIR